MTTRKVTLRTSSLAPARIRSKERLLSTMYVTALSSPESPRTNSPCASTPRLTVPFGTSKGVVTPLAKSSPCTNGTVKSSVVSWSSNYAQTRPSSSMGPSFRPLCWPWWGHGNICICLPTTKLWLRRRKNGSLGGKAAPSLSDQSSVAAILRVEASLQNLHEKIDAGPVRKATKKTNARPSRRDSTVFAAIILDLKGMRYCSFLKDHGVKPKWSEPCPSNYCAGYQAGNPWQKKIQDEKSRAKARMEGYTDPALADAFNFYLPDSFKELSGLLNSRNSRPASKNPSTAKPH